MQPSAFDVLVGLRLSIVRRAADMLVLHFGTIRPHSSGEGTVADCALHVQCPWRLDSPKGTVTGRDDLWEYAGPGGALRTGPMKMGSAYRIRNLPSCSCAMRARDPG